MSNNKTCWYPVKNHGFYEAIPYDNDCWFENKDWIFNNEDDCQELCDKLNEQVENEINNLTKKCFNNILNLAIKFNIDKEFIYNKFLSKLDSIKSNNRRNK